MFPLRIPLQTKLTKRCPHPHCRHLLIQPDTKTTRFKIKMVASNYLPEVEVGRRRRRIASGKLSEPTTVEEVDKRRRERRRTRAGGKEEDEDAAKPMTAGEVVSRPFGRYLAFTKLTQSPYFSKYTFELAFTNPLYDPIQIRLTQPKTPKNAPALNHRLHIPTQHFTVAAFKDAWAYDEEEEEDDPMLGLDGSEGTSEGSGFGHRSRIGGLGAVGLRGKKTREGGVEKRGNISNVAIEVEMLPGASGSIEVCCVCQFGSLADVGLICQLDLEVRYTYRVDEPLPTSDKASGENVGGKAPKSEPKSSKEFKTFTFWVRLRLGEAGSEQDA